MRKNNGGDEPNWDNGPPVELTYFNKNILVRKWKN
jgi:hypothetical protein